MYVDLKDLQKVGALSKKIRAHLSVFERVVYFFFGVLQLSVKRLLYIFFTIIINFVS